MTFFEEYKKISGLPYPRAYPITASIDVRI